MKVVCFLVVKLLLSMLLRVIWSIGDCCSGSVFVRFECICGCLSKMVRVLSVVSCMFLDLLMCIVLSSVVMILFEVVFDEFSVCLLRVMLCMCLVVEE